MHPAWAVAVVVLTIGGVVLAGLLRATAASARELADEVARFGALHGSLAQLRRELSAGSSTVRQLRNP
jgi:hypothetical protein